MLILIMKAKLIPPVKAHVAEIGMEKNTRQTKMEIEAISLPHIISIGVSKVVNKLEKVLFSRSKVIDEAEKAGTRRIRRVRLVLKKSENKVLPLAEARE